MNYISAETGQSLQLFHMDEVRPLERGPFLPDLIAHTTARYKFVKPPVGLPAENAPIKFEFGKIFVGDLEIVITSLEIYRDGIIVNTRNTEDSDAVLTDFFGWIVNDFGFRAPITIIPRRYVSVLIVELKESLDSFLAKFEHIQNIVSEAVSATRGVTRTFHMSQFTLTADIADVNRDLFRLEIRNITPPIANRYFSNAPLPTRAHLAMLAALERAVAGD